MTTERRIEYAVAPDGKSVTITGQTHRFTAFADNAGRFISPGGFIVESFWGPEACEGNKVFVRGNREHLDNQPITGTPAYIAQCVTAFDAYNEAFRVKAASLNDLEIGSEWSGPKPPQGSGPFPTYSFDGRRCMMKFPPEWDIAEMPKAEDGSQVFSALFSPTPEHMASNWKAAAPPAMQPPFEGKVEGFKDGEEIDAEFEHVCPECRAEVGYDDDYCGTCGIWMDANANRVIKELGWLIDGHAELAMRPAMHARLRRLIAGEKA